MLKRKMTEMDWAISSSSAPMTGAVAAMAEPPQMEEPTPTSTEILLGIFSRLHSRKEMTSDTVMVVQMMGRDRSPTLSDLGEVQAEAQQDDRVLQGSFWR